MEIVGLILVGLVAGALAASLGIGGGIIFVPALVSLFGFSQLDAQGTSLAIIVPTAMVAAAGHIRAGRILWDIAIVVGIAGIIGAVIGAQVAYELDERTLQRVFAIVLVILAIRMMYKAWSIRPATSGAADRS